MSIRDKLNKVRDKGDAADKPAITEPKIRTPSLEPPMTTTSVQPKKTAVNSDESSSVIRTIDELFEKTDADQDTGPKTLSSGNLITIEEAPAAQQKLKIPRISQKITVSYDVAKFLESTEGKKALPDFDASDYGIDSQKLDPEIDGSVVTHTWVNIQVPHQITRLRSGYSIMYVSTDGSAIRTFVLYKGNEPSKDATIEQFTLSQGQEKLFRKLPSAHGPISIKFSYVEERAIMAEITGGKDKLLRARDGLENAKESLLNWLNYNKFELTAMTVTTTAAILGIKAGISLFGYPLLESIGLGVGTAVTDCLLLLSIYYKSKNM